jgi:hypothetical protein
MSKAAEKTIIELGGKELSPEQQEMVRQLLEKNGEGHVGKGKRPTSKFSSERQVTKDMSWILRHFNKEASADALDKSIRPAQTMRERVRRVRAHRITVDNVLFVAGLGLVFFVGYKVVVFAIDPSEGLFGFFKDEKAEGNVRKLRSVG